MELSLFTSAQADAFRTAEPFPHIVVEDLWSDAELVRAAEEFPPGGDSSWRTYPDPKEWGKACIQEPELWGPSVSQLMAHLQSPVMISSLERLTGLEGLTADALGGGMHMTGEGGRLDMHVDFNVHPDGQRLRKLNVLVFMNREWNTEWGGTLYLGAGDPPARYAKPVFPGWNRMVIFECSDKSWHGHPDPIVGNHWRKSLACYYYVPLDAAAVVEARTTTWLAS